MRKVFQTVVDDGSNTSERGNCMQAVVASLLELKLSRVPNFIQFDVQTGGPQMQLMHFLGSHGYDSFVFGTYDTPLDAYREVCKLDGGIEGYFYASVKSQTFKGSSHAVVVNSNMEVVHDPNPNQKCLGMDLTGNILYILTHQGQWVWNSAGNFFELID